MEINNPIKRQTAKLKRAASLMSILAKYGFEDLRSKINNNSTSKKDDEEIVANTNDRSIYERIKLAIEELGPTYIKFGQTLSTREDLFPSELIKELKKLQDNVLPEELDVIALLSDSLAIDPQDYFLEIDTTPIASASIAQTYKGTLQNGEPIVIKIKRPGIRTIVEADLLLIRDIVQLLHDYYAVVREINLPHIFDAFARNLIEELSFNNEVRNIQQFQRNFRDETRLSTVTAYPELSNDDIICMSYIDGCKINDIQHLERLNLDKEVIIDNLLNTFLTQILEHGFFHADPHPGNILVTAQGQLGYIDFGAMGRMLPKDKELLEDFIIYFINKDASRIVATIKKMAIQIDIKNEKTLERVFAELLDIVSSSSLENIDVKALFSKFSHILNENNIIMPEHIYLLVKGIVSIEGIGRELKPDINIIDKVKPYVNKITAQRFSPEKILENNIGTLWELKRMIDAAPKTLTSTVDKINEGQFKVIVDHKEFTHFKTQELRNNSLNRLLTIAVTTFIGGCILADVAQDKLWGISIIAWILFSIAAVVLIILLIKRNKITN